MFSQSSAFHTPDNAADRVRSPLSHSTSQTSLHGSFSVGGMAGSTGAHHPHSTSSWASNSQSSTLSNSLNDPFLQSRSSYQSGYLMVRPFHHAYVCLVHLCLPPVNLTKQRAQSFSFSNPAETKCSYPCRFHHPPTNGLTTCPLCRPRPS